MQCPTTIGTLSCAATIIGPTGPTGPTGATGSEATLPCGVPPSPFPTFSVASAFYYRIETLTTTPETLTPVTFPHVGATGPIIHNPTTGSFTFEVAGQYAIQYTLTSSTAGNYVTGLASSPTGPFILGTLHYVPPNGPDPVFITDHVVLNITAGEVLYFLIDPNVPNVFVGRGTGIATDPVIASITFRQLP